MEIISNPYNSLCLEGRILNKDQLREIALDTIAESPENWKVSFWSFILEWINNRTHIEVKTSGSTGDPKIMRFSKKQFVESAKLTQDRFGLKADDKALLCLPAEYIAGMLMIVRSFVCGLDLWITAPKSTLAGLPDQNFDFTAMLPFQLENLLMKNPLLTPKFKTIILGGTSVSPELEKVIVKKGLRVYETYGMTETLTHIAVRQIGTEESFNPLSGVQIKSNQHNCLEIKAPHLGEKWIVTNDIVTLDSENRFKVIGRIDNVINTGGLKFYPEQLERKISNMLDVNFMLAGKQDSKYGQRIVLLMEGNSEEFIKEKLMKMLDKKEMPKEIIRVDKIYLTQNGKIDRAKNKKIYNLL